jgi:RNA 2',3'-cyclic 3'-phosphodiesterase
MRLFTAIEISAEVRNNLRALLDRLRPMAKLSWTHVDNLHITTKFIGEWQADRLEEVKRALLSVTSPGAIQIRIGGAGWFPNARSPRVLWAGVKADELLKSLAHATETAVHAIGVPREDREYSPHLTLARIRDRVPPDALSKLRSVIDSLGPAGFGSFLATEFHLYLSAAGKYTKLAQFGLTGGHGI